MNSTLLFSQTNLEKKRNGSIRRRLQQIEKYHKTMMHEITDLVWERSILLISELMCAYGRELVGLNCGKNLRALVRSSTHSVYYRCNSTHTHVRESLEICNDSCVLFTLAWMDKTAKASASVVPFSRKDVWNFSFRVKKAEQTAATDIPLNVSEVLRSFK